MKVKQIDKTLEQLEGEVWEDINYPTNLVKTIYLLRKKILKDFSVEDLRIVIGQSFSLPYLIPLAIEKLNQNILAEGDYFEGDLLKSVLDSDKSFWVANKKYWQIVKELYVKNEKILQLDDSYKQLKKSFEQFVMIHDNS